MAIATVFSRASIGIQAPQVTIEAKFVEIDEVTSKALGYDWLPANTLVPLKTNRISSEVIPLRSPKSLT